MGDLFSSTAKILEREKKEEEEKKEAEARERQRQHVDEDDRREKNKLAWKTHFSLAQVTQLHNAFKELAAQSPNPQELTAEQLHDVLKKHGVTRGNNGSVACVSFACVFALSY